MRELVDSDGKDHRTSRKDPDCMPGVRGLELADVALKRAI
jgi:hypothetical protein